jgi:hypothetical protein
MMEEFLINTNHHLLCISFQSSYITKNYETTLTKDMCLRLLLDLYRAVVKDEPETISCRRATAIHHTLFWDAIIPALYTIIKVLEDQGKLDWLNFSLKLACMCMKSDSFLVHPSHQDIKDLRGKTPTIHDLLRHAKSQMQHA